MSRRTRQGVKPRIILIIVIIVAAVVVVIAGLFLARRYAPGKEKSDLNTYYDLAGEDSMYLVVNDQKSESNGFVEDGEGYLPVKEVQSMLNNRFYWDDTGKILRLVEGDRIVQTSADTASYTVGKSKEQAAHTIVKIRDKQAYLSWSFVRQYTAAYGTLYQEPNRMVISTQFDETTWQTAGKNTQIREKGGIKSPVVAEVERGERLHVTEELDDWSKVITYDGEIGYIQNKHLGSEVTEAPQVEDTVYKEVPHTHTRHSGKISMLWHQVTNQTANASLASVLSQAKGINVISPTWFYLNDNEGNIVSHASSEYVNTCHNNDIQVWALVSNIENGDVDTTKVLCETASRDRLISNLISAVLQCGADGINVDFESLKNEVGYGFIEFIRELSVRCATNGLILSVDNYPPSSYTGLYYRTEQAAFADYLVLMAYDEHFSGSEEAGPVASISYVNKSVKDTLKEVPADQIVLGMPLYSRLWQTKDGKVASRTYGMQEADKQLFEKDIEKEWDAEAGQYYASWKDNGTRYDLWLEDDRSLEEKLKVMQSNKLAGASFWKYGYQRNNIWSVIGNYMKD